MSSHAPGEGGKNAPVQITEGPSTVVRFERSRVVTTTPRGVPCCRRITCSSFEFSRLRSSDRQPITGEQPRPLCMTGKFGYGGLKPSNGVFHLWCIVPR